VTVGSGIYRGPGSEIYRGLRYAGVIVRPPGVRGLGSGQWGSGHWGLVTP